MLGLLAGFRWFADPRFMGATAERDPALAADRRRRPPPARGSSISVVAIVLSVVALGVKGLNLGIDFKGGVQITFVDAEADVAHRRCATRRSRSAGSDAVVQGRGKSTGSDDYKSFQIRLKKLDLGQAGRADEPT